MKEQKETRINPGPVFIKVGNRLINIDQIINIHYIHPDDPYVEIVLNQIKGGYNTGSTSETISCRTKEFKDKILPYLNVINLD